MADDCDILCLLRWQTIFHFSCLSCIKNMKISCYLLLSDKSPDNFKYHSSFPCEFLCQESGHKLTGFSDSRSYKTARSQPRSQFSRFHWVQDQLPHLPNECWKDLGSLFFSKLLAGDLHLFLTM